MSDALNLAYEAIDREHADKSAATRRKFVAGAAGAIGSMGLLSLPQIAGAQSATASRLDTSVAFNDPQTILNVAATVEVLATIVNTVALKKVDLDPVTRQNIASAAREELIHFVGLRNNGGRQITKKIWVPDKVFSSKTNLLKTLVAGDQIFINAYLIATTTFGAAGNGPLARAAAEFMGSEAVHRALARQSLGLLGNDRVYMRFGFENIETGVKQLKRAGFGFGVKGAGPGQFYNFDRVKDDTPNPKEVNTRQIQ